MVEASIEDGERTLKPEELRVGQKVELTYVHKAKTDVFTARINWVEDRGDSYYFGYTPDDNTFGKWGCAHYYKSGHEKPYGVKIIRLRGNN